MSNPFVGQWQIRDWRVSGMGAIPENAFRDGTLLTITPAVASEAACDLDWDQGFIKSLPFDGEKLTALPVEVSFPKTIGCHVHIWLESDVLLHAKLSIPGDGNTGTFAADAHPPKPTGPE